MDETTCRTCGKPILWIRTEAGKAMPLDAKPVPVWVADINGVLQQTTGRLSHFATCPQADEHRRPRENAATTCAEDTPMPFGKHKGTRLGDVPASYLLWLGDQSDLARKFPALHGYIENNRAALEDEE